MGIKVGKLFQSKNVKYTVCGTRFLLLRMKPLNE